MNGKPRARLGCCGGPGDFPVFGLLLIVAGSLLLLQKLDLVDIDYVLRYWPLLLIAAGGWILFRRLTASVPGEGGRS
jgi:hypothetical protein